MSAVQFKRISKHFGRTRVLEAIDFEVAAGEFCCLVGPSGCGKSTLLRLIAGLEDADAGHITIGGQNVNDVRPSERGVAMVFQSYALCPHMTVFQNLAFGLQQARLGRKTIQERIDEAARMLQLEALLQRLPKQLSGGQRQRVAIGRAIVREPNVFLFDEPLSNLDAGLRQQTRGEIARLHRRLRSTMIYVTHDQLEAMTLADRLVVLRDGRVEQTGRPLDVYHNPQNRFVAGFLGSPPMNFIDVELASKDASGATVRLPGESLQQVLVDADRLAIGSPAICGIRAEHVMLSSTEDGALNGQVDLCERLGDHSLVTIRAANHGDLLTARVEPGSEPVIGDQIGITLASAHCHLFDENGVACPRFGRVEDS